MIPYPYNNLEVFDENCKHYTCLCPFHREDEGSFTINKGGRFPLWFKCWGCGVQGSPKQYAEFFKMNPDKIEYVPIKKEKEVKIDWNARFTNNLTHLPSVIKYLSLQLGLWESTLKYFDIGAYYKTILIPMFGTGNDICGIQEHWWEKGNHKKKLQAHSKHGIFKPKIPFDATKPIIVNEGFSDTACSVEMGFQAIGKYNALFKPNKQTIDGLKKFKRVLIISDNDDVGRQGAGELYEQLPNAVILVPPNPYSDVREWMLAIGRNGLAERLNWLLK